jgi:hypothetical protein
MRKFTTIAASLAVLLAGCAQVPMAPQNADAEGKLFDPPAPGSAVLYLYRDSFLGSEVVLALFDNQQQIGTLANKTWLRTEVPPGPQTISCASLNSQPYGQGTTIDLAPGDIRFMAVAVSPGAPLSPRCAASEVSPDQGRTEVQTGHRALLGR